MARGLEQIRGVPMTGPSAGLCSSCRHQQIVRTTRGSVFSLCRRSVEEPDCFTRYPRLPVLACPGYERGEPDEPDEAARRASSS